MSPASWAGLPNRRPSERISWSNVKPPPRSDRIPGGPSEPLHLTVRVMPNASRNEVVGWQGDALKLKIQAPATDGRANQAVVAFLAEHLGVPARSVILTGGEKSRQKRLRIHDLAPERLAERLSNDENCGR